AETGQTLVILRGQLQDSSRGWASVKATSGPHKPRGVSAIWRRRRFWSIPSAPFFCRSPAVEFNDYLKILSSRDGSDLYLSTGAPPCAKFQGVLRPLEKEPMRPG